MEKAILEELRKLDHLNPAALDGRTIRMLPVWDGTRWHVWTLAPDGHIIPIQVADAARSLYLTKSGRAADEDVHIPFVEFLWQRLSYPEIAGLIGAIEDDFHLLATSAAKLEHMFATRSACEGIVSSFVRSEIEYILIVARSVFDLLQEAISRFWNDRVKLSDENDDALKRQNRMPTKFSRVAFASNALLSAEEIRLKFALPFPVAEQYARHGPFFESLRSSRDRIIHGAGSVGLIFVTEKGFAVDPTDVEFAGFEWTEQHRYNEQIASLLPWIAHVVMGTVQACSDILGAFASNFAFPEELAPGFRILLRDPSNPALIRLLEAHTGQRVWWDPGAQAETDPPEGESASRPAAY